MVSKGGEGLLSLTIKTKSEDDESEIPVLLASNKGHRNMVRYLFSGTPWSVLLQNNCRCASVLLSRCISAEIFDVAAALLQHTGAKNISLDYESDQCLRPLYALAHIPSAFRSGTKLNCLQRFIYHSTFLTSYLDYHSL
ncbi:uncharacterized protein LOC113867682 [Abrus precatorius]|uniref:Uncharacterized protein LOC113867682 n=1 Tax=Abrus precatorius TaxID=3816 RepID=A0A8B8LRJ4_ABRPR|nr:uncharacterized protein LOC113867682 [Abrus precatorius]